MDCLSPIDPCEQVVAMLSSQFGKTEALLNFLGYVIAEDPGPILAIQPNVDPMGEAFSKDRVAPMLRDTPTLRAKVGDQKARDSGQTIRHKTFPGGHLTIAGANSPAGLASRPIRFLLGDELDRWEATKEGNALSLARKRLLTYRAVGRAKEVLVSSPTRAGMGIHAEYSACDEQHELHLRCPDCGKTQMPKLRHFIWPKGGRVEEAVYACGHCGVSQPLRAEARIKARAEWVCTRPCDPQERRRVGFWGNQFASPFASWLDTLREFLGAGKDAQKLQAFTNTAEAEVWEDNAEKADGKALEKRRENYGPDALPDRILLLTAGVDVQADRLECEIVGWRAESREHPPESWGVEYRVLHGDPAKSEVWAELDRLLLSSWRTAAGRSLRISAVAVDSGGHHTAQVYAFCAAREGRRVRAIKGVPGAGRKLWPAQASKSKKYNAQLWLVGVDTAKDATYSRLKIPEPGPGYCHFPARDDYDKDYFDGLTCEQVLTRKVKGFEVREWHKPAGARNEPLDCRAYALAVMHCAPVDWLGLARAAGAYAEMAPPPSLPPPARPAATAQPAPPAPAPVAVKRPGRHVIRNGRLRR